MTMITMWKGSLSLFWSHIFEHLGSCSYHSEIFWYICVILYVIGYLMACSDHNLELLVCCYDCCMLLSDDIAACA